MSRFPFKIVDSVSELPDPNQFSRFFCDVETVSGTPKRGGSLPYLGDRICGIALKPYYSQMAYYVPIRHLPKQWLFDDETVNLPVDATMRYFGDLLGDPENVWLNHNVKFDAHFFGVEGVEIRCSMIDTLVMARLVDMQANISGYKLKQLAKEWLGMSIDERDAVDDKLKELNTQDFGAVPIPILGEYACSDVQLNQLVWEEIVRRRYENDSFVWNMEIDLTRALYQIERRGLRIDMDAFQKKRIELEDEIGRIEDAARKMGGGFKRVNLSSDASLRSFIIGELGLPVLEQTDKGAPSVKADVLKQYLDLEEVQEDPKLTEFFELVSHHRDRSQFMGLYIKGWGKYIDDDDVIRPSYNQSVRSGRMSCSHPNFQQLNKEAKALVIPFDGYEFASRDYSQIEYRIITELAGDRRIIEAYKADPKTDFHQFVADICGIDRKPAKNVNFGIAFGMGEPGLIRQLLKFFPAEVAEAQAHGILRQYNQRFPGIQKVASRVKKLAQRRGWVKTFYGRRRALRYAEYGRGYDETRKGFNSAVQGTAADIAKEALVRMELAMTETQKLGAHLKAIVHDEILFEVPVGVGDTPEFEEYIQKGMCTPSVKIEVPLYAKGKSSTRNWAEAG